MDKPKQRFYNEHKMKNPISKIIHLHNLFFYSNIPIQVKYMSQKICFIITLLNQMLIIMPRLKHFIISKTSFVETEVEK